MNNLPFPGRPTDQQPLVPLMVWNPRDRQWIPVTEADDSMFEVSEDDAEFESDFVECVNGCYVDEACEECAWSRGWWDNVLPPPPPQMSL